ncbi:6-pyruvoyl trahydropterin synthase family protein [Rubricoccus marinus]|uniref:6-carboxy-5,6,7,8-tetrahydropterin synthase n=1 Tax=Rubricoccus marinus TaxID=716817 RepID=A0A259TWT7_9BACT|nr:6-carboxytetrahydropterin synthase [Rubricoccus marinus]OZC02087.1 6-pyruvoyl tetrahydrobiopterin synthase [Rubricoccus marinus]
MPTVYVTRKAHFNAAHRLHNPEKSDDWNRETFGKCNSSNWHGHNYELDVTVAGEPDPETGFVVDLADLKQVIRDRVEEPLDHKNLNLDVPFLKGRMTSTETLAIAIWEQLQDAIPGSGRLYELVLRETPNNSVVYRGE